MEVPGIQRSAAEFTRIAATRASSYPKSYEAIRQWCRTFGPEYALAFRGCGLAPTGVKMILRLRRNIRTGAPRGAGSS